MKANYMKLHTLIVLLFCAHIGFAQTAPKPKKKIATATLALSKKEDIITTIELGSQGFIIKTGESYAGREKKIKLHRYAADLTKQWTVELPKSTNTLLENYTLSSPYGNYTYHIQSSKITNGSAGKMIVTRIDEKGKTTLFDIKVDKDISKSGKGNNAKTKSVAWPQSGNNVGYISAFVDEEFLYLLAYIEKVNSNKDVKKKNVAKKTANLVLFKASHKSREIQRFDTEIELQSDEASDDLFIEFLGVDDEHIYLSKKTINLSEKNILYNIYTLDKSGNRIDESPIEESIEHAPVPSVNFRKDNGSRIYNNDYDVIVHTNGRYTYYTYVANTGSFGCSQLDMEKGMLYVYGLSKTEDKKGKKDKKAALGDADYFYIKKFDFNTGDLVESIEKPLPKEMLNDKDFSAPSLFISRQIWLDVLTNDLVRFSGCTSRSTNLHSICVNMSEKKIEYVGKVVPLRKNSGSGHRQYLTNVIATKMESTKEYQSFLKSNTDFRTKDYSIFGLILGDKRVVGKNYSFTKNPHIELSVYPVVGASEEEQ
jgi:hypothetical protein